jgi:hypothetical protein
MTQVDAALIREQGVNFAVVAVRPGVLSQPSQRESVRDSMSAVLAGIPVVVMEPGYSGRPQYHGRPDLVQPLANVYVEQLPWATYSIT